MKARGKGVFNLPNKPGGALEKVLGKVYKAQRKPGEDIETVLSRIAIPIADVKQMFRDKALADAEAVEGEEVAVEGKELTEKELQALKDKMDLYGFDNLSNEEKKVIEAHREFFFPRMKAKVAQREGMTRKDVKDVLKGVGVENRFSLRTVNFPGRSRQVVTIKDWRPELETKEIRDIFRGTGVIVDFEPAKGTYFVYKGTHLTSSGGHWECPNHPEEEAFVVYPPIGTDKGGDLVYSELGIVVGREGSPTDMWEDGTAGVQPHIMEAAGEEESAYCADCGSLALWIRETVVAQEFVPVPFDQAMIELYQAATPSIPNIVEYLKTLPEGEMLDPNDYTIPAEAYERIHEKYEDQIPVGTWTLLMLNKGPKILGQTWTEGETHNCIVCGKMVTINPHTYAPPSTDQPIQDTGLWRDPEYGDEYAGGYVCAECIPKINWSDDDWGTIEYDWGIQRPMAVAQAEEEKEEEEPEEPEKEIVSCLRCENFDEETQKCNLQEKEDVDNIIAFVLQNGCNLFEAKEEFEEAPPEGEKMEEGKVVKQELPYQAGTFGPGYSVDEPDLTEKMGPVYTVWDTVKNVLIGSVFPEVGVIRFIRGREREEMTGLEKDKDALLQRLIQHYEGEAGKVARLIRDAVTPGLLDPDVLTEEWAQNRILDIMAERFPHVSHSIVRQASAQILESWQFLRKPYFLSRQGKSMTSEKGEVAPTPDPAGFEDGLGGFTVRTGRSGRSTMLRRIGSPGRKAQPFDPDPGGLEHEEWLHNLWRQFDDWYHSKLTGPQIELQFTTMEQAARYFLEEVMTVGPPQHVDEILEDWGTSKMGQVQEPADSDALWEEYQKWIVDPETPPPGPSERKNAERFLVDVKGLDPSVAGDVIETWYGPGFVGRKAQEIEPYPFALGKMTDMSLVHRFERLDKYLKTIEKGRPETPLLLSKREEERLRGWLEELRAEINRRGLTVIGQEEA